ncbi:hypothetical protein HDV05_000025 [Chytridiales sp. JEL 0842]|nr:hypothetical protein HDV05_000025 [Chytridiales sp. JEL 0842]
MAPTPRSSTTVPQHSPSSPINNNKVYTVHLFGNIRSPQYQTLLHILQETSKRTPLPSTIIINPDATVELDYPLHLQKLIKIYPSLSASQHPHCVTILKTSQRVPEPSESQKAERAGRWGVYERAKTAGWGAERRLRKEFSIWEEEDEVSVKEQKEEMMKKKGWEDGDMKGGIGFLKRTFWVGKFDEWNTVLKDVVERASERGDIAFWELLKERRKTLVELEFGVRIKQDREGEPSDASNGASPSPTPMSTNTTESNPANTDNTIETQLASTETNSTTLHHIPKLLIELENKNLPTTVNRFLEFVHEEIVHPQTGSKIGYIGSKVKRLEKGGWLEFGGNTKHLYILSSQKT